MAFIIDAVVEYNDIGYLVYADNFAGAYTRGKTQDEALAKLSDEIKIFSRWSTGKIINEDSTIRIVQRVN